MSDTATTAHTSPGLIARAIGMVVSPTETYRAIVERPRAVGILFIVCLVFGLATGGPMLTEAGKRAALEMQVQQIERFTGQPVTPDQYVQMEQRVAYGAYATMAGVFIGVPFMTVLFSALYWAFFNIVLGGNAGFGQVVTVNAHSQVITALGALLGAPIQILQGTFSQAGPFNLGALAPMLDPASGLALFLGAVTFFGIWQSIVCGIGLGVLYRRAPAGIIIGLLVIYLGMTALFTVGLSSVMGGNH
jgi:hypothetical protein